MGTGRRIPSRTTYEKTPQGRRKGHKGKSDFAMTKYLVLQRIPRERPERLELLKGGKKTSAAECLHLKSVARPVAETKTVRDPSKGVQGKGESGEKGEQAA